MRAAPKVRRFEGSPRQAGQTQRTAGQSGSESRSGTATTVKVPWHERKLPDDWSEDEIQFFKNWVRELASLHDALTTTANDRFNVLRRARNIYFKLAHKLDLQIRGTAARSDREAASYKAVEAVRG